jgi:hypothetical protein
VSQLVDRFYAFKELKGSVPRNEGLTAVKAFKISFLIVVPCGLVDGFQSLEETYRRHTEN